MPDRDRVKDARGAEQEEIETVADLDADRRVYYMGRRNGADTKVHIDPDCDHLDAERTFDDRAGHLMPDRGVCAACTGTTAEKGIPEGTDVNATRRQLLALEPEDLGLSPRWSGGDGR